MSEKIKKRRLGKNFLKRFTQIIYTVWHNKLWILFLAGVTAVFSACYSAGQKQSYASATLFLRYDEAYEGLNPNGTRFNINELLSDAVLNQVIEKAGASDTLSVNDLLNSIAITASGSQSPKNKYIATEYNIWLNDNYLPQQISAENMLGLLMETYKQFFLSNYGSNDSALNINWSDVDDWEYIEFSDIMTVKVNNLITYLEDLRKESGMYQYHTTGETFRSLSESVANFRDIYLNKYTSYVSINGLYKRPQNYRSKLQYRSFLVSQSLKGNEDRYRIYQDALGLYDESMITFVMVPMYDATNGLYMARTSVGMDNLTSQSKSYAEKIETNSKEIKVYEQTIQLTKQNRASEDKYTVADSMIKEIQEHLDSLISRIRAVKKAYESDRDKNSLQYSLNEYSLFSGFDVKGAVKAAAVMVFLCIMYYAIREYTRQE
ncbi:MAG: hypothetical protein IKN04_21095 [Clostridia bacterium]|nr:hypothetical protein [Clostridia bacterium]